MSKKELIQLLEKNFKSGKYNPLQYHPITQENIEDLVEHLLNNGVVVLPCKVGDVVYAFCEMLGTILEYKVVRIELTAIVTIYEAFAYTEEEDVLIDTLDFEIDDIGKNVFLSREEAERALKERIKGYKGE